MAPFPFSLAITDACWSVFVEQGDLFNAACLRQTLAKSAGLGIVFASALLKLPIFRNAFRARTTAGLSPSSLVLETAAFLANGAQSYILQHSFSTWGELVIIGIQNALLLLLMGWFGNLSWATVLAALFSLAAFLAAILNVPAASAHLLVAFAATVILGSRLPQIWANFKNKSTGVLSPVTVTLQIVGISVRLVTIVVETQDAAKIAMGFMGLVLNSTIMLQLYMYRDNTARLLRVPPSGAQNKQQ